jgi:hypothetical protein
MFMLGSLLELVLNLYGSKSPLAHSRFRTTCSYYSSIITVLYSLVVGYAYYS